MLQSMGWQSVGHDLATKQQSRDNNVYLIAYAVKEMWLTHTRTHSSKQDAALTFACLVQGWWLQDAGTRALLVAFFSQTNWVSLISLERLHSETRGGGLLELTLHPLSGSIQRLHCESTAQVSTEELTKQAKGEQKDRGQSVRPGAGETRASSLGLPLQVASLSAPAPFRCQRHGHCSRVVNTDPASTLVGQVPP